MPDDFPPRVLSDEEIEMYLKGDRRDIDRLILYSLNRLAAVLVPHAEKEEEWLEKLNELGGFAKIRERAEVVDSLIEKNNARAMMMNKVSQSTLTWAVIAFAGFLLATLWNDLIFALRMALKAKGI